MNRHYSAGEYLECVKRLRRVYEHPAITTDVIVGFPGETEEEFQETRKFLEQIRFYEMHIFRYSRRRGTVADRMPEQIPEPVKAARSTELLRLEKEQSVEFRRCYIGEEETVLFEEQKVIDGRTYQIGHTTRYVKVAAETEENLSNRLMRGRITGFITEDLLRMESFVEFSGKIG